MENNNDNNNINNNNENLGGVPARRVRDFDLNKEPTPSPQVSGNGDCHMAMGEVEEVQSDQVLPVVQTAAMGGVEEVQSDQAMGGVEEVQSDQVPAVVQTEPSKDKGKRPMVFSEEEAHDKVDGGGSGLIQENIAAAADDDDISHQPERKRHRSDSIKIRAPRVKVLLRTENEFLDDGYRWRKYGQKNIKGNNNVPRAYYRCCDKNCLVRKQVERDGEDQRITVITYEGRHNHEQPPTTMHANAAIARAKNAILHSRINRNYNNNIAPMQLNPLHYRYRVFEYGSSSNGSSAYPSPVVLFPAALPTPPPPPPTAPAPAALPTPPAAAAAVPPATARAGVNLNLNLSLNPNECGTSSAPAEECSNKVPKNDNDDQQNDI